MQATIETDLAEYYQHFYRPERHAHPGQTATRHEFRTQIRNYNGAMACRQALAGERLKRATLADLTDDNLAAAMAWQLENGRSASTANKLRRTIASIWKHAIRRKLIAAPPDVDKLKENRREPVTWTPEQMRRLIDAGGRCPGKIGKAESRIFWPAYLLTAWNTAGRKNVLRMTPTRNFDPLRGEILLPREHQKQRADQIFELHDETIAALIALASGARGLDRLFGDAPLTDVHFDRRLKRLIVAAGLRKDVASVARWDLMHNVRRHTITQIASVHGEEAARKFAGHSAASVTERYIDKRQMPGTSARQIVPQLQLFDADPPPPERPLGIYRPAG